jgi:UDP-N-acetylmuramoylalanine--D-glutamate ligase
VYNADDDLIREAVQARAAETDAFDPVAISIEGPVERGTFVDGDTIVFRGDDGDVPLMPAGDLALRGPHNLYNSLAAATSARLMDIPDTQIREGLATFSGVPHRLETVATVDGVRYINDSKATNVNAVRYALESFDEPIVLIAGGRDKGNDYGPLASLVRERVRGVVALGESAEKVMQELGSAAACAKRATTMEDALAHARDIARPGDVVLLSPACSSFDMYENYEERGDTFRRLVRRL